jgi:dienelactone hydrolase
MRRALGLIAVMLAATTMMVLAGAAAGTQSAGFSPTREADNFAITLERAKIYDTLAYQRLLTLSGTANLEHALAAQAADRGRLFEGDACWQGENACAGDVRLYDWASNGYGLVRPVLFTARDGATISGHIWATVNGPAKRPGVVITTGSYQSDEQMYWYAAQTLAKEGFIVMTFDVQGQGMSDTFGQKPDTYEGFPAQVKGSPWYDGTEDAINFFLSTAKHPYEPVKSCSTGTSHAAKQNERVEEGLDSAYNPYWQLLDPKELGLAGHSFGAAGDSYLAQWDPRVKAVVAWDNLGGPSPDGSTSGDTPPSACPSDPGFRKTVPITKPGLGISADYGFPATPNSSLPNPLAKSTESLKYSKAGVDSGEIIIRGGSHVDFSFIPNQAFGASYYGPDIIDWYTTAWFDRFLKPHDQAAADRMLLSKRWLNFAAEAAIDPLHDGNAFSFYYSSRLDFHLADGRRWDCENLRNGCLGMVPAADDGWGVYDYLKIDTTKDASRGPAAAEAIARGGSWLWWKY